MRFERGSSLLEVLVALAIMGLISVGFLSGVATTSTARVTADERASAKILAESIIDAVKKDSYDTSYNVTIPNEYAGYSANLTVDDMANGIQKLTVAIWHSGQEILTLENYKVNR